MIASIDSSVDIGSPNRSRERKQRGQRTATWRKRRPAAHGSWNRESGAERWRALVLHGRVSQFVQRGESGLRRCGRVEDSTGVDAGPDSILRIAAFSAKAWRSLTLAAHAGWTGRFRAKLPGRLHEQRRAVCARHDRADGGGNLLRKRKGFSRAACRNQHRFARGFGGRLSRRVFRLQ